MSKPRVSIVIPVHNHLHDTLACLTAVVRNTDLSSIEVIVCDDASTDDTFSVLTAIDGLDLVRLDNNVGFLGAISAAIAAASGDYLLMLNNDTEVQPGWLTALLDVAEADPAVGAVGSKLVFPDGRLQEAGSMVWDDGTAWNRGTGCDTDDPEFNYRCEVDYCSAASLLVRRSAYDAVGGFDSRYTPAYYEDTDLCFALRHAGFTVIYQPESVVIHQGSASHSTVASVTTSPHSKRGMETNRHLFSAKWATTLDRHWPHGTAAGHRGGRIDRRPRILVVDWLVPTYDRDSGGLRMTSMIEILVELGCHVTLLPCNGDRREPYSSRFQRLGVEVYYGPWRLEDLVRDRPGLYDMVLLSRPNVGEELLSKILAGFPGAALVYDTVDLHHLRELRRLTLAGETPDAAWESLRRTELRLIRNSDVVAAVSREEADEIRRRAPGSRCIVLPNVHDLSENPHPDRAGRSGVIFIGSFLHAPNVDAVRWFVTDIWPALRDDNVHFTILGSDPPPDICALASDRIHVTGYVPDVNPYFARATVLVAPLRYGAGVKGKIGQAMALGLPVVTTTPGGEGMGIVDGVHALVRDDPKEFAHAVQTISDDVDLWARLSRGGTDLIRATMSRDAMRERLRKLLADMVGGHLTGPRSLVHPL